MTEPLEVVLVAAGTQGDVAPVAALGGALKARGHAVTLVADALHAGLATGAGLDFHPAAPPEPAAAASVDARLWHHVRGFRVVLEGFVLPAIEPTYAYVAERQAKRTRRLVVAGTTWALGPRIAHEALKVPFVTLHLCPANFRSNRLPPHFKGLRMSAAWPGFVKRFVWWLLDRAYLDVPVLPALNAFRRKLGLPPVQRVMHEWLHSPQAIVGLFPDWFAPPQTDWPQQTRLTGFVQSPGTAALSDGLRAFLDSGPPPVVFTIGSARAPVRRLFSLAVAVCRRLGERGILLGHDASVVPADLPDTVRFFGYVPLGALLSRAAALVHHGGIGTAALALRAGVPQVAMPMAFDQFDNAERLARLGVGTTLDWLDVTEGRLADVLGQGLASAEQRAACARLAASMAGAGDVVTRSCELIEAAAV